MSVKTGDTITSANLKTLVNNLITLYNNRTLWLEEMGRDWYFSDGPLNTLEHRSFYVNSLPIGNEQVEEIDIEPGSPINENTLGNLIRKVLVINDVGNLKDVFTPDAQYHGQNVKLFYNGSTQDLIEWSNTYKNKKGADTDHGCRGACVGICSGGCHGQGKGRTGTSSGSRPGKGSYWGQTYPGQTCKVCGVQCTFVCGGGCQSGCLSTSYASCGCGGGCKVGCLGSCSGSCGGSCSGNCYGGCSGSCNNTCTGTCSDTCSGTCGGACSGCGNGCGTECAGECQGACQATCKKGCAVDCKNGCFGGAK